MWEPGGVLHDATSLSFYEVAETLEGGYAIHGLLSFMRKWSLHSALKRGLSESREAPPELILDSEVLPKTDADEAYETSLSDRLGAKATTRNIRLSFFAYPHRAGLKIDVIPEDTLLGSARVTMINAPGYSSSIVSDCVVRCPLLLNNYVHLQREFNRTVRERPFRIQGTYFCQQDGLTGVCAHAAARMYLANHPRGPEDLPSYEHINTQILGLDTDRVRRLGTDVNGGGLNAYELVKVLSSYNLNAFIHDYDQEPDRDYAADVYTAVESQSPALLAFRTKNAGHVVVVVGHTLNTDLWLPQVQLEYFEEDDGPHHHLSNMWVEDYVVHDDNFGMLRCLPAHCLGADPNAPGIANKALLGLLGPAGKALACISDRHGNVDGKSAEIVALDVLYDILPQLSKPVEGLVWLRRLQDAVTTARQGPVLRTFQTTKADYLGHLRLIRDREGLVLETSAVNLAESVLPDYFWITEFTLPDLYTVNKRKLGEVLCSANDPHANDPGGGTPEFLLLRLPGYVTVDGHRYEPTSLCGHVEILHQPSKALHW